MSQVLMGANTTLNSAVNTPGHLIGQTIFDDQVGARWMYVKASAAITQYAVVGINSVGSAVMLTSTLAATGAYKIGMAQVALSSAFYGWVQIYGPTTALVLTGAAVAVPLYTTASAGYLGSASASQTEIRGVTLTTSASATSSWPAQVTIEPFTVV